MSIFGPMKARSRVVDYDPCWPRAFRREAERIGVALGSELKLQHIGSTAVPGLIAKPIIDMLGEVAAISAVEAVARRLAGLGYEDMGAHGVPGRRYFRRSEGVCRSHHLHLFAAGSVAAWAHLAVRDYLRSHPREAQGYAAAKRAALTAPCGYRLGKVASVEGLVTRACDWAGRRQIVASQNDPTGRLCVDIRRDRSGFAWVECRRDPEDDHGWRETGRQGGGFATASAARQAAAQTCNWVAT